MKANRKYLDTGRTLIGMGRDRREKTGFRVTEECTAEEAQRREFTLGRYEGGYGPQPTKSVLSMAKLDARRHVRNCGRTGATKVLLWREVVLESGAFGLELVKEVKP